MGVNMEILVDSLQGSAAALNTTLQFDDGDVVYHQGDASQDIYLIVAGYLKFTQLDRAGSATITAILDAGQLFGEGLYGGKIAAATAMAKGKVTLQRYSNSAFTQLLAANSVFSRQVITMLAQRQRLVERRLQAVLHLDVRSRIAVVLNDLSTHFGGRCGHGHEVDVPLTQQELSELVGASRPVVSSRLNDLRREGLLAYSRGYICVDDLEALNAVACGINSEM